jgi:tRNA(Ile)-lysidine synthase
MSRAAVLAADQGPAAAGAAILARVRSAFDERLDPGARAPLAVGFSGGGDSLALLLAARAWAKAAGRPVLALTVDHGLQAPSRAWTAAAGELAGRLGVGFRALHWTGDKPEGGLPAAARRARHALLAEAARRAGARVLLLGHTRDDLIEAERMRAEGSNVGSPRLWSPSPVWPEGRDVFLLRPLLGLGRAELRELLAPAGLSWIEDPANDDLRYARARARRSADEALPMLSELPGEQLGPVRAATADAAGVVRLDPAALLAAPPDDRRRLLGAALVCAGGGERLPRAASIERLLVAIEARAPFTATLAGARITAGAEIIVARDAGRMDALPRPLRDGDVSVWDGRFELSAAEPGWSVRPLRGLAARLDPKSRQMLAKIPAFARPALPVLQDARENIICPILAQGSVVRVRTLICVRLAAACGGIARESQVGSSSDSEERPGALS